MTGLYVKLDTNWPDHPKVIAAGLDGAGLHAAALCLAKRFLTDGVLHRAQLRRYGGTDELIAKLCNLGLLEPVDKDHVAVHDWLDRNPSRQAIGGRVGAMQADGKRGNHKRWKHPGDIESCPRCNPASRITRSGGESGTTPHPIAPDRQRQRQRDIRDDGVVPQQLAARDTAERHMAELTERQAIPIDPAANVTKLHDVRAALRPKAP